MHGFYCKYHNDVFIFFQYLNKVICLFILSLCTREKESDLCTIRPLNDSIGSAIWCPVGIEAPGDLKNKFKLLSFK